MPHHDLVETLVRKENMAQLQQILNSFTSCGIAPILDELPPEDQVLIWEQLDNDHKQSILPNAPVSVLQILGKYKAYLGPSLTVFLPVYWYWSGGLRLLFCSFSKIASTINQANVRPCSSLFMGMLTAL
jgi:hypothetical protein